MKREPFEFEFEFEFEFGTEEKKRRFANHLPCQVCRKLDVGGLGGGYCALRVYFHCAGQS
jgi:hypothetical protein